MARQVKDPSPRKCLDARNQRGALWFHRSEHVLARIGNRGAIQAPRDFVVPAIRPRHRGEQGEIVRSEKKPAKQGQNKEKNVGDALRAVYREAVQEQVPDELLELLKKLD